MRGLDPASTALLVIDVQKAFEERDAAGDRRNNPDALARIVDLLGAFRAAGAAVIHIHHASTEPNSRFRPERPGFAPIEATAPRGDEPAIVKQVNAGFIGTDLEARLRAAGKTTLVITGATTNHCVETTTRMAGNLGFDARLVRDATWAYDQTGPDGELHRAEDVHAMTLANLDGEFAEIVTSGDVITALSQCLTHIERPEVPLRDPEKVKADTLKWGDAEKVATTTIKNLIYREIDLCSRYDKAHEYQDMMNIVDGFSLKTIFLVNRIFCDSKACATYSIQTSSSSRSIAKIIADQAALACLTENGGYNGIYINYVGGDIALDPDWAGDVIDRLQ